MSKDIDKPRIPKSNFSSFMFSGRQTDVRPEKEEEKEQNVDLWQAIGELQSSIQNMNEQIDNLYEMIENLSQQFTTIIIGNINDIIGGNGITVTDNGDGTYTIEVDPEDFLEICT